jgi:sugar O-acyltransferase (sialic acid O-acetyltransferase NeuD family)
MVNAFALLGSGNQADEAEQFAYPETAVFRAVSAEYLVEGSDSVDIATLDPDLLATPVVAAVGAPGVRRTLVESWAGSVYGSIISPEAWVSPSAWIGPGAIIAPFSAVSANVVLGRHVLLNLGSSISHGSLLGDYVTVSPGARIAGDCRIGDGVFLGIGAIISNGISIAAGTVIGAGAVLVAPIDEPGVYVGVPARRLRESEGWLRAI